MVKKILLVVLLYLIFQLSSTSSLRVISPHTWMNKTIYNPHANVTEILNVHSRFYKGYFPTKNGYRHADADFYAHKVSHMTAYSLLAFLLLLNLKNRKWSYIKAWLGVFIVAFLDEVNQFMIVGRTGLLLDVILDCTCAAITLLLVYKVSNRKMIWGTKKA